MDNHIVGFLAVFGAMFAIANPFSGLPFFLGYTSPLRSQKEKLLGAVIATATIAVGAIIVLYFGNAVLNFFGVTIPGLRVGGGFVILLSGLSMMKTQVDDTTKSGRSLWKIIGDLVHRGHDPAAAAAAVRDSSPEARASMQTAAAQQLGDSATHTAIKEAVQQHQGPASSGKAADRKASAQAPAPQAKGGGTGSVFLTLMFPFAIPMILGPGFMSTILISAADNSDLVVLAAIGLNVGISLLVFILATPIRAVLGTFGMNVLLRLVGLIVIVLAFEIMAAGLVDLIPGLAGATKGS